MLKLRLVVKRRGKFCCLNRNRLVLGVTSCLRDASLQRHAQYFCVRQEKGTMMSAGSNFFRAARIIASLVFVTLLIALSPFIASAQNCTNLAPSGDTTGHADWNNINTCLNVAPYSVTLGIGRFYIYQQILFPQVWGAKLLGSGNTVSSSVIEPVYASSDCSPNPSCFVADSGNPQFPLQYQPIILTKNAPNGQISNFMLDLNQLRKSYNHLGSFAIQVGTGSRQSPGTQVTSVRIVGDQTTTGWANGGGIVIVSSSNSTVNDNILKDFGFTTELGTSSVGHAAINVQNSSSTSVQNNTITRVSIGIEVVNNANQPGDSSYTNVSGNNITGATGLTCSDCSGGRSIKLQANGDALPPRHLVVQNNVGTDWGGQNQGATTPVGLVLVAGVQYSTFTGNSFDGSTDTRASYGLQIRSSFDGLPSASYHNTFTSNTFRSGSCTGCFDVFFNDDGPDQGFESLQGIPDIGKRKVNGGNNTFNTMKWQTQYDNGCSQFAHAWFDYPPGQTFVSRGQNITLSAAGIWPNSLLPVIFDFYDPNGIKIDSISYSGGNGNCVMNQQLYTVSASKFLSPGLYKILATYYDGNSSARIVNDWIGTGGQQVLLDVR
jgi:hypothetical protein